MSLAKSIHCNGQCKVFGPKNEMSEKGVTRLANF